MLSETHLEQLREAFPTTEWEASKLYPDSWTGRFRGGLVAHLTSHPFDEVYIGITVWEGAKPYVSKSREYPTLSLVDLVVRVVGDAIIMRLGTESLPEPPDYRSRIGLSRAMLLSQLDPRIQEVVDKLLVAQQKKSKAEIKELRRRIKELEVSVECNTSALTTLRKGEPDPSLINHLHRNIRRDLPAEWCSLSRLHIQAELVPGLTVDVGQAIYTPTFIAVWCEVRLGECKRLFDGPIRGLGLIQAVPHVVQSVATALVEAVVRASVPALDEAALRALPAWLRDAVTEEIALPEQDRTWGLDVEELVKLRVLLG